MTGLDTGHGTLGSRAHPAWPRGASRTVFTGTTANPQASVEGGGKLQPQPQLALLGGGQTPRDRPGPPTPDKGSWGYVHTLGPDGKNGQGPACPGGDPCRPTPPRSSPSEVRASVSVVLQLSTMSHRRTVRSQEALARTDFVGLKHRPLMGPS